MSSTDDPQTSQPADPAAVWSAVEHAWAVIVGEMAERYPADEVMLPGAPTDRQLLGVAQGWLLALDELDAQLACVAEVHDHADDRQLAERACESIRQAMIAVRELRNRAERAELLVEKQAVWAAERVVEQALLQQQQLLDDGLVDEHGNPVSRLALTDEPPDLGPSPDEPR